MTWLLNTITIILAGLWTFYCIFWEINLYIAYIILAIIIGTWLFLTVNGWRTKSKARGDSWEPFTEWIKSKIPYSDMLFNR